LSDEFGQTEFALLANNPNYAQEKKQKQSSVFEHYETTYNIFKDGNYQEVLERVKFGKNNFKDHPLAAKYDLVEAIAYAGIRDFSTSKQKLQSVIQSYPNSDEQKKAQEILALISKSESGDSLNDIQNKNIELLNKEDATILGIENIADVDSKSIETLSLASGKGNFVYEASAEHKVMIFVKMVDGRTMALKSAMSDYNLLKHNIKEYTTNLNLLTTQQAVITIDKFSNASFAKKYAQDLEKEKLIFSQLKKEDYDIMVISQYNFTELLKTRDIISYIKFYKKFY
jgi:hypothetical protein